MKHPKYEKKTIKLHDGKKQEYHVDSKPKAYIAQTRSNNKIYVNKKFEKLSRQRKLAIIYHERGHSKFILYRSLSYRLANIYLLASAVMLFSGIVLLLVNLVLMGIISIIVSILLFIAYTLFYWLQEIISDSNAIKKVDKKIVINTIAKFYKNKDFNIWNDWIMHPPWSIRRKIMEKLD